MNPTTIPARGGRPPGQLSRRVLNRTLLARQFLLGRTTLPALDVLTHLVAMQAQEPNWPYVGLWTRVAGFRHDELESLLRDRHVVRSTALRSTQHLVGAEDFRWLRPLVQPVLDRTARAPYFARETAGLEPAELDALGRELLAGRTLSRQQLGARLVERWPGRDGRRLAAAVELRQPMTHQPATGSWGRWGNPTAISVTLAEDWLRRPMHAAPPMETLVHRYLAAFGPATVADLQAWSGLTRLREVVDGLRAGLRVLRDEHDRELFDLPDAPLADPDTPAPVRFLPAFDNVLLGHADRTRVISDEHRALVMPGGAMVRPTFLVDGRVRGVWRVAGPALRLSPFGPLARSDRDAVLAEAGRLHPFVAPPGSAPDIAFDRDDD
ncbi:winged helix DNA-binding domain-containing protein [Solihabitans fulvus]|uniref:Winged helix DNA-binding domain-containing protein n=1 Tax=Solihabitans fulvus TaxID=1892852 RepID=A0A5B2WBU8_9PSEU|nr:winged helix DNA-binding domain-containing protein [Solihabitans fulvus]KAA2247679.1 winged helix DNA-binding domain-containing protein [Solihabitans fulvus]